MSTTQARSDADNKRKLDQLVPIYEEFRSRKIRADADKERADKDVETAKAEAVEFFGTSDLKEIDAIIEDNRAANTESIDAFAQCLKLIRDELAQIEEAAR